jgi:hypothetical protein
MVNNWNQWKLTEKSIAPWYTKNYQFSNVSIQSQVPLKETIWNWYLYKEMYGMETIWSKDCWKYQDLYLAIKKKNHVGKIISNCFLKGNLRLDRNVRKLVVFGISRGNTFFS